MEERYDCPPMNFKQKLANFWYYHKWLTIAIAFFVVFIVIATIQYIAKEDPDVTVMYVGDSHISEAEAEGIIKSLTPFVPDENGDGKVVVDLRTYNLIDLTGFTAADQRKIEQAKAEYKRYKEDLQGGDACILMMSELYYKDLADNGALVDLYQIFLEYPASSFDYYGMRLDSMRLGNDPGMNAIPDDTVLCLKFASALTFPELEDRIAEDEKNMRLFREIVLNSEHR